MKKKLIKFLTVFIVLMIPSFLLGKYILEHQIGYGAIDYVNTNIPDGFVFTGKDEIPNDFLIDPEYKEIQQVGGMFSKEFYCQKLHKNADIIKYWEYTDGYGNVGGWAYRFAAICGDDYIVVYGAGHLGEAVYGPFKNTVQLK